MNDFTSASNLTSHCLISMPDMPDPRFQSSLIFICAHSDEGAMGLIVNKPADDVTLADLLDQTSISKTGIDPKLPIHFGGPVEPGRGFVLHSTDYHSELSSLKVDTSFSMTSTLDILEDVAIGAGPAQAIYALGYAGWAPGQLENEIAQNGWLIAKPTTDLVFETPDKQKWSQALHLLGIDPAILSSSGGRA